MKPQYITLFGTTPKIVALDTNMVPFNVSIRPAAGVTVELSTEAPNDFVQPNTFTPRVAPAGAAVVWVAAPAAGANGVIVLKDPYAAVRFTPTTGGECTIMQQGLR